VIIVEPNPADFNIVWSLFCDKTCHIT